MERLFAKYRSYWPANAGDSAAADNGGNGPGDDGAGGPHGGDGDGGDGGDGGAPSRLSSEQDLPACEDPNDAFDDMEDVELAKALGVPDSCVERMTPVKAKPHVGDGSSEHPHTKTVGALEDPLADGDRAQWRQKRISDLKSLAQ